MKKIVFFGLLFAFLGCGKEEFCPTFLSYLCDNGSWQEKKSEVFFCNGESEELSVFFGQEDNLVTFKNYPAQIVIFDRGEILDYEGQPQILIGSWSLSLDSILTTEDPVLRKVVWGKINASQDTFWVFNGSIKRTFVHPNSLI